MNAFMKASLIRAARTIAQTAVATIGTAAALSAVDWRLVVSASILAGILSILTSVATGLPEVDNYESLQNELEGIEDPDDDGTEEEFDDD